VINGHASGSSVSAAAEHGRRFCPLPVRVPQFAGAQPPGHLIAGDGADLDAPETLVQLGSVPTDLIQAKLFHAAVIASLDAHAASALHVDLYLAPRVAGPKPKGP